MPANLENSAEGAGLEKVSFHSNPKERQCQRMFKLPHNWPHLTCWQSNTQNSPSQAPKVHELWTCRCAMDLEKAEEPEIKLPTSVGSSKMQKSSRETTTFALLTMPKPFTVWITINCGKFWKRWEYQTTWPASWEICMQAKKQQLELDMEQQTGSKLGNKYIKAVYCHPAYLNYVQSILWEMLDWMKHKLESRLLEEISTTSDIQMIPP